ncbi:unnamed protein product [Periconia digitata]|uniref:NAD(P)-binding protein n=1 Tax=Periconia digitata TaxID=1303443 RepID=A0A9W4UCU7_9PLEO|nr:unnamed protein product [Periconia digitata]
MSPTRTIIVFGSGPGIGIHLASHFATHGPFTHVILLARNTSRVQSSDAVFLKQELAAHSNKDVKIDVVAIDLADLDVLPGVLIKLDGLVKRGQQDEEVVEVVVFNAARIRMTEGALDLDVKEMEEDLRTTTLSLYLIAQHYLPRLSSLHSTDPALKPALLITNSHLPHSPIPQLLSLSLSKAAQRNMAQSFNIAFREQGVHVGLITVHGVVGEKKEDGQIRPSEIARKTWEFYEEGVEGGLEVVISGGAPK